MNNADQPAHPIPNGADGRPWTTVDLNNPKQIIGLTKRERFAMAAMQGLQAASPINDSELIASLAVEYADALLKALEATNA